MTSKLFQNMRFNILSAALAPGTRDKIPDDYVFAWDNSVYPIYSNNEIVETFAEDFEVSREMMSELLKKLDEHWDHGNDPGITFYELEDYFEIRMGVTEWDRAKLINAVTYLYLHFRETRIFSQGLFDSLIHDSGAPSEANSFMRPFNRDEDVYLV